MNDYTGKYCPYCKVPFTAWDDIVVCSDCDMPHHRQCWIDNQVCTTFGCLGTMKNDDNPTTSVTAIEITFDDDPITEPANAGFCTACGAPRRSGAAFCTRCGRQLTAAGYYAPPNTQGAQGYRYESAYPNASTGYAQTNHQIDPIIQHLVKDNSSYYMPQFIKMRTENKTTSWNWSAFLFAAYWLIYRKMYLQGGIALAIIFILTILPGNIGWVLLLGFYISLGIYGNYLYLYHLEAQLPRIYSLPEPYRASAIASTGGVNIWGAILTLIGYGIFIFIIFI